MENLLPSTEDENRQGAVILNTDVWFLVLEEVSMDLTFDWPSKIPSLLPERTLLTL